MMRQEMGTYSFRREVMTWRAVWLAVAVLLAGCGGDDGSLSEAFCADLDAGMSIAQILSGSDIAPADKPDRAWGMALASCPDQLRSNDALRGFLEANGIDPDTPVD